MWKKIVSMYMVLAVAVSSVGIMVPEKTKAAATIAGLAYTFSSMQNDTETVGTKKDYTLKKTRYGGKREGYKFTLGSGKLYASINGSKLRKLEWSSEMYEGEGSSVSKKRQPVMTAGKKFPWEMSGLPYFEIVTSSSGYENLSFSALIGATKKGPKNYHVSYAVGNSDSFTDISSATLSLGDNKKMERISANLPAAAKDRNILKIRITASSMTTVEGKSLTDYPTGGEIAINNIVLQGDTKGAVSSNGSNDSGASGGSDNGAAVTSDNGGAGSGSSDAGSAGDSATGSYKVKKVSLNTKVMILRKKSIFTLQATVEVTPDKMAYRDAAIKKLKWRSSNTKIVKVSKRGKVKAKRKGTAKITVRYKKKKAKCKIIVR